MSQHPETVVNLNQKPLRKRKAQEPGAQEEQPASKRRKQVRVSPEANYKRPFTVSKLLRTTQHLRRIAQVSGSFGPLMRHFSTICLGSSSENVGNGLTVNRAPSRAGSAAPPSHDRSTPSRNTKPPSRDAQAGSSSGVLRVGQSSSALSTIPEPELDDNQEITAMQSELDSVVGRERSDLSKASSSQFIPHFDLSKGKLPSKSFSAPKPKSKAKPPSKAKPSKPPVLRDKTLESAKKALQEKVAKTRRSSLGQRGKRTSDSFGNGQPGT